MSSPQATQVRSASKSFDSFFRISERGSTVAREIRGGLVTFFTMAYIVMLNPLIIGTQTDSTNHYIGGAASRAEAIPMVAAATALVAGVMNGLLGGVAKHPPPRAAPRRSPWSPPPRPSWRAS